jgi:hypothetical protein
MPEAPRALKEAFEEYFEPNQTKPAKTLNSLLNRAIQPGQ